MASFAAAIPALFSIGGGIAGAVTGSNATQTATGQQVAGAQNGINEINQILAQQTANQSPFISAGQSSIGQLMNLLSSGKLGPGSTTAPTFGAAPTAPGAFTGTFTAPTLSEAQNTPGYQFTAQQGNKGILEGAAAAGGAISGGTLKALDSYNTGLADSTYNDVFNRSLATYNTGLQAYQTNLQDYASQLAGYSTSANTQLASYEAQLAGQQQGFNELLAPAALGEGAASSLNANLGQGGNSIAALMAAIGNSKSAGTIGSNNYWQSLIGNIANNGSSLLSAFLSGDGGGVQGFDFNGTGGLQPPTPPPIDYSNIYIPQVPPPPPVTKPSGVQYLPVQTPAGTGPG